MVQKAYPEPARKRGRPPKSVQKAAAEEAASRKRQEQLRRQKEQTERLEAITARLEQEAAAADAARKGKTSSAMRS